MNPEKQARIVTIAKRWWPERQPYGFNGVWWWTRADGLVENIPDFLHDWAAMGLLLERLREKGFEVFLGLDPDMDYPYWCQVVASDGRLSKPAPTLPEAVAAAAEAVPQDEIERALS